MKTNHIVSGVCFALLAAMSCASAKKEVVKPTPAVEKAPVVAPPPVTPVAPAAPVVALEPQTLPETDFKKFEPTGEYFSVKVPTNAKPEHPKDETGKENPAVWTVRGPVGQYTFLFTRHGIPASERAQKGSNEEIFRQHRELLSQSVQGTVKNKTQMKYKGADAEDWVITGPMKQVMGRVVLTDNAVYTQYIYYDATPPAYARDYFDSLDFSAPPPPPAAPVVAPTAPGTHPVGHVPPKTKVGKKK